MILLLIGALMGCSSHAQEGKNCNRTVRDGWEFLLERLPSSLCLPSETVLINALRNDFDEDGIQDVIVEFHRSGFGDGDTLFIAGYKGKEDSTFSLIQRIDGGIFTLLHCNSKLQEAKDYGLLQIPLRI
ncbi:MAG: hypothetical protein AAGC88_12895 [Bacteroidota bacterium]